VNDVSGKLPLLKTLRKARPSSWMQRAFLDLQTHVVLETRDRYLVLLDCKLQVEQNGALDMTEHPLVTGGGCRAVFRFSVWSGKGRRALIKMEKCACRKH